MVDAHTFRLSQNLPVHINLSPLAGASAFHARYTVCAFNREGIPLEPRQCLIIGSIDKRDLALRKRYLAGIGIGSHCEPHSFAVVRVGQLAKAVSDPIVMADTALHFNQVNSLQ